MPASLSQTADRARVLAAGAAALQVLALTLLTAGLVLPHWHTLILNSDPSQKYFGLWQRCREEVVKVEDSSEEDSSEEEDEEDDVKHVVTCDPITYIFTDKRVSSLLWCTQGLLVVVLLCACVGLAGSVAWALRPFSLARAYIAAIWTLLAGVVAVSSLVTFVFFLKDMFKVSLPNGRDFWLTTAGSAMFFIEGLVYTVFVCCLPNRWLNIEQLTDKEPV